MNGYVLRLKSSPRLRCLQKVNYHDSIMIVSNFSLILGNFADFFVRFLYGSRWTGRKLFQAKQTLEPDGAQSTVAWSKLLNIMRFDFKVWCTLEPDGTFGAIRCNLVQSYGIDASLNRKCTGKNSRFLNLKASLHWIQSMNEILFKCSRSLQARQILEREKEKVCEWGNRPISLNPFAWRLRAFWFRNVSSFVYVCFFSRESLAIVWCCSINNSSVINAINTDRLRSRVAMACCCRTFSLELLD